MLYFDHINILSENLIEITDYYRDFLGMTCHGEGFGGLHGYRLGNKQSGGNEIVFWRKEGIYGSESQIEIVFKTDNLKETYEQLMVKNPNIDKPYEMDWGWEMRFHDPLGNVIYFVEE